MPADHTQTAATLNNLAATQKGKHRYKGAESLYLRALSMEERRLGPEHLFVSKMLNNLAEAYYADGLYEQAEPLYRRSLAIAEKTLGAAHPDFAIILSNYALVLRKMHRKDEARRLEARIRALNEGSGSQNVWRSQVDWHDLQQHEKATIEHRE